jgi:hypothetical protein
MRMQSKSGCRGALLMVELGTKVGQPATCNNQMPGLRAGEKPHPNIRKSGRHLDRLQAYRSVAHMSCPTHGSCAQIPTVPGARKSMRVPSAATACQESPFQRHKKTACDFTSHFESIAVVWLSLAFPPFFVPMPFSRCFEGQVALHKLPVTRTTLPVFSALRLCTRFSPVFSSFDLSLVKAKRTWLEPRPHLISAPLNYLPAISAEQKWLQTPMLPFDLLREVLFQVCSIPGEPNTSTQMENHYKHEIFLGKDDGTPPHRLSFDSTYPS